MEKRIVKEEVLYLFKGGTGVFGINRKQTKAEDFVKIRKNTNIPSIPIITSSKIYIREKKTNYFNRNLLTIILVICILSILLLKFIINDYFKTEELKSIEFLISNLCFAFIASYIFYAIVIKRTEKNKKTDAYAVVCGLVESMVTHGKTVKKWLLLSAGEEITQTKFNSNDIELIKSFCEKADVYKELEDTGKTTAQLLYNDGVLQIKHFSAKIFEYMPFLDGELIYYLNQIQGSNFYRYAGVFPFKYDRNLSEFSYDIREYLGLINDLEKLNNRIKSEYLKDFRAKN